MLKGKYLPIFDEMDIIVKQKKMEYLDRMIGNLESNCVKTEQEKKTLTKIEKSFNELKPFFRDQLKEYLDNIEHNNKVAKQREERET